jgi:hypothetical protein
MANTSLARTTPPGLVTLAREGTKACTEALDLVHRYEAAAPGPHSLDPKVAFVSRPKVTPVSRSDIFHRRAAARWSFARGGTFAAVGHPLVSLNLSGPQ